VRYHNLYLRFIAVCACPAGEDVVRFAGGGEGDGGRLDDVQWRVGGGVLAAVKVVANGVHFGGGAQFDVSVDDKRVVVHDAGAGFYLLATERNVFIVVPTCK
jgi:hypothetical protein